jgi:hypothetical protein
MMACTCGVSLRRSAHQGKQNGKTVTQDKATELAYERAASSLGEVIEMLATMLKEFQDQETQDKENWAKYQKWSDDTEVEKNEFIQNQKALIMATKAKKAANEQMVQKLTTDLATLVTDIAETRKSLAELIKMREEEHAQFQISLTDVTKTIAAVTKATEILEGHYGASGEELVEIRQRVQLALTMYGARTALGTQATVSSLTAMLQTGKNPDFLNTDGSKYDSYQKQGGAKGVVGMLTDLRNQLESQKQDLIAKESESVRQFQETKAAKEADLAHMLQIQAEKTALKAECEAIIQECIATIDQAEQEIIDSQAYLKQLLIDRETFTKAFGDRNSIRKSEMAATQAALDALQSVSAGAKSNVGLLQMDMHVNSHRAESRVSSQTQAGQHVKTSLNKIIALGKELKATALVQVATKLQQDYFATEQQSFFDAGSFGPILKLLSDLIAKLEEEAAAETSQHEWCETEKTTSVATKEEREKNIHNLKASIVGLTTNIAQLKTEILFLESEIERVKEETRIAIEIRKQEKATFEQAKKDHEEVIGAINTALAALSGQYGFLQIKSEHHQKHMVKQPGELGATPFAAYKSGDSMGGGAMAMLEDLLGKYSEALEQLILDEEAAVKAHEDLLKRNAKFIEDTTADKNSKTAERRGLINDIADDKTSMKQNLIELHEVSKYLQDLRPSCDDIRSTFEERTKRREAEISALKQALEVISDPTNLR